MFRTLALLTVSSVLVAAPAMASEELAKSKNCLSCHQKDKKMIGPAFKDIAAKYKDDAGAIDKLADKVIKGGSGVWGPIPMPPNQVTPEEAKTLVTWIVKG